ncbi:hypothetical protein E3N88_31320 [Mikania micrantha]|uniref:Integrase catalytic domain-containing protein n=1 Tax=Mikania micrantha TaxID=192012 RepID=A0A5N6MPZ5_9ASTR|nr:hypothetical protein E3N88_31320 [Mikania micrantha]
MWPYLILSKAQVFERFKEFKESIELKLGKKIKGLITDNGGEFNSQNFRDLCSKTGMCHLLTAPYSPQQNGVMESRNSFVMGMTRCLLKAMNLPQDMWGEGVSQAIYILNRTPTKAIETTPYEAIKGRKPSLGPVASKRIYVSRDAKFDESKPWNWERKEESLGPKWTEFLVHTETKRGEVQSHSFDQDPNGSAQGYSGEDNEDENEMESAWSSPESTVKGRGPILTRNHDDKDYLYDPTRAIDERYDHTPLRGSEELEVIYEKNSGLTALGIGKGKKNLLVRNGQNFLFIQRQKEGKYKVTALIRIQMVRLKAIQERIMKMKMKWSQHGGSQLLLLEGEPTNYKDAKGVKEWEDAMAAEIRSIEKNKTWELTEKSNGITPIGLKWVYKVKRDVSGEVIRHKARLVAKGCVQQHGVDFEEVFAPVARIGTVRLILVVAAPRGWWVHHMDVKSAFLHGDLKELVFPAASGLWWLSYRSCTSDCEFPMAAFPAMAMAVSVKKMKSSDGGYGCLGEEDKE